MPCCPKKHKCTHEKCEVVCVNPSSLVKHMRTHTGGKPFKCQHHDCGKSFTQSGILTRHMRTHTGVKPYACEKCKKAFSTYGNLCKHMLTHSGVKPHVCKTCDKTFSEPGNLVVHMRTHSGVKPYACETCGEAFSLSVGLRRHVIYNHTDKDSRAYKEFTEKINAYHRDKYATHGEFRVAIASRGALRRFLNTTGGTKSGHTEELVGCTWAALIAHLNDNSYGYYVGQPNIHVDHIRPIASFSLSNGPIAQHEAMNWNNLQLMWGTDNISKGSHYNAEEYANSDAGKAIAKLRAGWDKQFKTNEATDCNEDSDDDDMGESDYEDENA